MKEQQIRISLVSGKNDAAKQLADYNKGLQQTSKDAEKAAASLDRIDGSAYKSALETVREFSKEQASIESLTKKAQEAAAAAVRDGTEQAYRDATKALQALEKEQAKQAKDAEKAAAEIKNAYDDAYTQASQQAAKFGDVDSGIGAVKGIVGAVSPQASQALTIGQDAFAAAEGLQKLPVALKAVGDTVTTTAQGLASGTGLIASGAQILAPVLVGLGGGIAALAAVALPIVAIVGAAAVAVAALNAEYERQKKAAEDAANNIGIAAKAQAEAQHLIASGDVKALDDRVKNAKSEYDLAQRNLQNLYDQKAALEASNEGGQNNGVIENLQKQINDLVPTVNDATISYKEFQNAANSIPAVVARGTQEQEEAAKRQVDAIRQVNQELNSGLDTAGIQAQIDQLNQALALEAGIQENLKAKHLEGSAAFAESAAKTEAMTASLAVYQDQTVQATAAQNTLNAANVTYAAALGSITTQLANGLTTDQLNEQISNTTAQLRGVKTEMEYLAKTVGEDSDAYKQAQAQVVGLNAQYQILNSSQSRAAAAANDHTKQLEENAKALESAGSAIEKFNAAADDTASKRALTDSRAAEDSGIQQARSDAALKQTLQEQAQANADKLVQIEQSGADKAADLREQLAEGVDNYYQQIADSQSEFQDQQRREQEDFDRQNKRARRDYQKELAQIEKDAQRSTLEGLLSNDFGSVIAAQENADAQAADKKDAFKTNKGDTSEDFAIQQQREADAQAQKLADIQEQLDAFREGKAQEIAATEQQTAAQLAAQQQTFDDQQAKEQSKRDLAAQYAAEDAQLKADRLAQDRQLEDAAKQAALDAELARITEKADAETAIKVKELEFVSQIDTGVTGLIAKAQQFAQQAASAVGSSSKASSSAASSVTIPAFANEGVIPQDGIYRAGEPDPGYREAVVKFKSSEGLQRSMAQRFGGGGDSGAASSQPLIINVNNPVIADVIGEQKVHAMITDAGKQIIQLTTKSHQLSVANARSLKGAKV